MITLIVVRNPFDVREREINEFPYIGDRANCYFNQDGNWVYGINGTAVDPDAYVQDGDCITVCPYVGKKMLGLVLSIGLAWFTGGLVAGTVLGGLSTGLRLGIAVAASLLGGAIITKLTAPPAVDAGEQSQTYGWNGAKTISGQGAPLAVTYGAMKSGGVLLSRHVISDGERQYLNLLLCAGEGKIDDIRDVRINGNPIGNYRDVQIYYRYGTNDQRVIPNFNDTYSDQSLSYELGTAWSTHLVQGNAADALEITVSFPQGLYYANDDGGMSPTYVDVYAEIRELDGEWMPLPLSNTRTVRMDGLIYDRNARKWRNKDNTEYTGDGHDGHTRVRDRTNKAVHRVYRFDGLEKGTYEIRMRCVKRGTSIRYINQCYWSQITQILYDDFAYPGKALIGIRALATKQLSGSDPQVTWIQERTNVLVWNPYRKIYEHKRADNPAWACYDILHQCREMDGNYVVSGCPARRIDYDAFKAWADECEVAGLTFNYIYDAPRQLWESLSLPENIGRGKVIMKGTRFSCVYDYAADPVQLFTVANIRKDTLQIEYLALTGRANAVEISYMNKDKNYERDVLPVFAADYDNSDSLNTPTQIELMGCTEMAQAYQHGKWYLRNNKYELRTITFDADVDAITSTIGDVVLVQHDVPEWGYGGRVTAFEGNIITLDAPVVMTAGKRYTILIRNSNTDEITTYDITGTDTETTEITLPDGATVNVDDIYAFGEIGKAAKPYRIVGIKRNTNDLTRTITAVEYHEELYTIDPNVPIVIEKEETPGLRVARLLLNKSANTNNDGTIVCDIYATWLLPRGKAAREIRVSYKTIDSDEWISVGTFSGADTSCVIPAVHTDTNYTVSVICVDDMGVVGASVEETINVTGKETLPGTPTDFTVTQDENSPEVLHLSWSPLAIPDIRGYRLYDGDGVELVKLIQGNTHHYFIAESGTYNFTLKAVDTSGNESETGATVSITADVDATKVEVPSAPASGEITMLKTLTAKWEPVTNTYIDYYELRLNENVGQAAGMLIKTTDIYADIELTERTGSILVYPHSPIKGYGAPLVIFYDFPIPPPPTLEISQHIIGGFTVKTENIPNNRLGINLYIENEKHFITEPYFSYSGNAGIYRVSVAYIDCIGEGERSADMQVTIKAEISASMLENESLSMSKVDQALKAQIESGGAAGEQVTQIVTALNGNPSESGYSALTQLNDAVNLRVAKGDVINQINIGNETTTIDGKYLHVTGQTVFDDDVIVSGMIQANAVTAEKMSVDSLSAITATIGTLRTATTGARTEIKDNLIEVYDNQSRLRVKMGVWS